MEEDTDTKIEEVSAMETMAKEYQTQIDELKVQLKEQDERHKKDIVDLLRAVNRETSLSPEESELQRRIEMINRNRVRR